MGRPRAQAAASPRPQSPGFLWDQHGAQRANPPMLLTNARRRGEGRGAWRPSTASVKGDAHAEPPPEPRERACRTRQHAHGGAGGGCSARQVPGAVRCPAPSSGPGAPSLCPPGGSEEPVPGRAPSEGTDAPGWDFSASPASHLGTPAHFQVPIQRDRAPRSRVTARRPACTWTHAARQTAVRTATDHWVASGGVRSA